MGAGPRRARSTYTVWEMGAGATRSRRAAPKSRPARRARSGFRVRRAFFVTRINAIDRFRSVLRRIGHDGARHALPIDCSEQYMCKHDAEHPMRSPTSTQSSLPSLPPTFRRPSWPVGRGPASIFSRTVGRPMNNAAGAVQVGMRTSAMSSTERSRCCTVLGKRTMISYAISRTRCRRSPKEASQ